MWKNADRPTSCALARSRQDPDAFGAFYEAYAERILTFMTRRTLDAEVAWDLTAETFARALQLRDQFRGSSAEEEQAWLYALAHTQLSRYWRRGRVERAALTRFRLEPPSLTDEELERIVARAGVADLLQAAASALARLPDDQREAVQLRVIDELDYPEVAARLGTSEDVARARVSRGVRALGRSVKAVSERIEEEAAA